ncbi:MAG: amidohydrolase family protein [Bacteroidia bacterium]|nr:amidohydrolase family protein [Bacteroidia bacterium]
MKRTLYIFLLLFCMLNLHSQQVQKAETGIYLLKNGQVETLDNGLVKADVLISGNRIMEIHNDISHPGAKLVDCEGLTIYPGLIDAGTRLGLAEVGSISLTQDHNEIGSFTPHMEALTAVNPNSVNIPVTRVNGITTVLTVPSGGRFPGTAALIDLQGYTPDQMYAGFKAIVMNYPSSGRRGRWDRRSDEDIKKSEEKSTKELNDLWEKAVLRSEIAARAKDSGESLDYNPQLDALVPVVNGETTLLIEVNRKNDILSAIKWVSDKNLKVVFTGVTEGYKVADSLAKYDIPVITGPVLARPSRASDKYDIAYANAGLMHKAGVKVALRTRETENVRNLPFNAGFAAAYGMGRIEALKSVTIIPAEIFGVDKDYGSVEQGKVANLFVTDGDPFETKTQVKHLFIKGWKIPLESRQTLLYDEFLNRSPGIE